MPTGSHFVSWAAYRTAYIAQLADKRGRSLSHKWYLDIHANTTIPDSHDHLYDRYVCSPSAAPVVSLVLGVTTNQKNRRWLVTFDGQAAPLFGKQLTIQPKKNTCIIVHWTSDCLSSPSDVICLRPCPDLCDLVVSYYNRLSILPDFSSSPPVADGDSTASSFLRDSPGLPFPVILPPGSHYRSKLSMMLDI
ncbi:hypothetical protein GLOIN_2v1783661 [Rhizophagus clarus]|uniref:Uncharacterized protein n=1 Tax=Rhizophagus clarus TaxID=94130 RepID=A0A8H3LPG7_9GLOM|nr:hypothetical protein GLOIN_2v1783661 [Rhizophagus clarus]